MMIDPMFTLAFAVHSTKQAYALLLGSGISRTAGIPTGWEVVLDLIRKLARLHNADCEPDPADWYTRTYHAAPDYSELLHQLAPTPAARQQLLRVYFEPTEDERDQGLKQPTAAHRAIAELVAAGTIRVVITTNFDHLLEQALQAVGIVPTVISTTDSVQGALPFHLTQCTIIKVHGDYLDTRIKNIADELASYDAPMNALLDRVFDEHGLIMCGWSGQWDTALRSAIERCSNHRFTTFWMAKDGVVAEGVQSLVTLRRAQVIAISSADAAFQQLSEHIAALDTFNRPHPLSTAMAVATLKTYLVEEHYRIRLRDLMTEQIKRVQATLFDADLVAYSSAMSGEPLAAEFHRCVSRYEALVEPLQAMLATGCYWGTTAHHEEWVRCIEQIAVFPPRSGSYQKEWLQLQHYPALLLLYTGSIAALAAERYDTFAALLTRPIIETIDFKWHPAVLVLAPDEVIEPHFGQLLPGLQGHPIPASERMFPIVRELLRQFISDDQRFTALFDRFEYLLGLVYADVHQRTLGYNSFVGPIGLFGWRLPYRYDKEKGPAGTIASEIDAAGTAWAPLQAGLFQKDLERLQAVKAGFDEQLTRSRR